MSVGGSKGRQMGGYNVEPFVRQFESESRPMRRETYGQLTELLRTGGVGARVPIIQAAVANQRGATSAALRGTQGQLSSAGLANTPFGQRIMAEQRAGGQQNIAGIPAQMAEALFGQAGQLANPIVGQVLGAMAQQSVGRTKDTRVI